jgi:hypothetical protein
MSADIQLVDWTGHLFRCSSLSHITSMGRGTQITDKQREELATLLDKIKLTEIQAKRRDELQQKLEAKPELSKGAKTYLEGLWVEMTFKRPKDFTSKYTDKGTEVEHESLHMANRVLGWGLNPDVIDGLEFIKQRISNEYITGEPDVHIRPSGHNGLLADAKSSWNVHTFPHFKDDIDPAYYAQGQGYMWLTGIESFQLVYCLVDTPERLINDEVRRQEWANGFIEIPEEMEEDIRWAMTFEDIPEAARVKLYRFQKDEEFISRIKESVELSREYLMELNYKFLNF